MQAIAEVVTMYSHQKLESLPNHEQFDHAETAEQFDHAETDKQFFRIRKLSDNNITRRRNCFFAKPHCRTVKLPTVSCNNLYDRGSSKILRIKPHGKHTDYSAEPTGFGISDPRSANDLVYEHDR